MCGSTPSRSMWEKEDRSAGVPLRGATGGYPSFNLFEVAGCAGQERVRRARFNLYEIVNASKNVAICTILTCAKYSTITLHISSVTLHISGVTLYFSDVTLHISIVILHLSTVTVYLRGTFSFLSVIDAGNLCFTRGNLCRQMFHLPSPCSFQKNAFTPSPGFNLLLINALLWNIEPSRIFHTPFTHHDLLPIGGKPLSKR